MYRIIKVENEKGNLDYQIVNYIGKYNIPEKKYGTIEKDAIYVWNSFAKPNGRASVLCTGDAGSGKTLFCKYLANIAVSQNVPVYVVEGIALTEKFIQLVSNLNECVIFIDEFAKSLRVKQDLFLSMLSDANKKRLFLLSENDENMVSRYIRNRPERIKYHFKFHGVAVDVVREYCKDHDVPKEFESDLVRLATSNKAFCFDHLTHLVEEAKYSNNWDLEWLMRILNTKALVKEDTIIPVKVTSIENEDVALALSPNPIKHGLASILVTDYVAKSAKEKRNKSLNSDPMLEISNNSYKPTDKDEETIEQKKELLKHLEEVYTSVTFDQNEDRNPFRSFGSYNANEVKDAFVKLNTLEPESVYRELGDDITVYTDVTKKFLIYLRETKNRY